MQSCRMIYFMYCLVVCLLLTACGSSTNSNTPDLSSITVTVKGKVDWVWNPYNLLDGSVTDGTEITAVYTIDPFAPPYEYSQPNSSDYFNSFQPGGVVLTVGNYKFVSGARTQLTITNGGTTGGGFFDGWSISAPKSALVTGPVIPGDFVEYIDLFDPTANILSTTALVPVPNPDIWPSKRIGVANSDSTGNGGNLVIVGEVTTMEVGHN